jgi:hypothetical protein
LTPKVVEESVSFGKFVRRHAKQEFGRARKELDAG